MFYLRDKNAAKLTNINLSYYVSEAKKNLNYATGLKIHPKDWDLKKKIPKKRKGNEQAKYASIKLNQLRKHLDDCVMKMRIDGVSPTPALIKEYLDEKFKGKEIKRRKKGVVEAYNEMMREKELAGASDATSHALLVSRNFVIKVLGKKDIDFSEINNEFYALFIKACRKNENNDNSVKIKLSSLKRMMRWAKDKGYHDNLAYKKFKINTYSPDNFALTENEVKSIESVNLLGNEHLEKYRDMFLIGIYSGQRFSDYSKFDKADVRGNMIVKRSQKKNYVSSIPLHPKLKNLLDKYDWNIQATAINHFNIRIKEVCQLAGIIQPHKKIIKKGGKRIEVVGERWEFVTSHTARRTFITLSLKKGVQPKVVMKIAGIKRLDTLNKYNKVDEETITESMMGIWD